MLNLNSKNDGQWFYFDSDNHDAGGVCLRELSPDEHQRIEKLTVNHNWKFQRGTGRRYDDIKTDEKLAERLRWDYVITDWKEVSLDGQVLECTTENKVKVMKVMSFVKFMVDALEELTETNLILDEVRVKNLESSSNGNVKSQPVKPA